MRFKQKIYLILSISILFLITKIIFKKYTFKLNNGFNTLNKYEKMLKTSVKHNHKTKYIIFECKRYCGGWADRLKGELVTIS